MHIIGGGQSTLRKKITIFKNKMEPISNPDAIDLAKITFKAADGKSQYGKRFHILYDNHVLIITVACTIKFGITYFEENKSYEERKYNILVGDPKGIVILKDLSTGEYLDSQKDMVMVKWFKLFEAIHKKGADYIKSLGHEVKELVPFISTPKRKDKNDIPIIYSDEHATFDFNQPGVKDKIETTVTDRKNDKMGFEEAVAVSKEAKAAVTVCVASLWLTKKNELTMNGRTNTMRYRKYGIDPAEKPIRTVDDSTMSKLEDAFGDQDEFGEDKETQPKKRVKTDDN